MLFRALNLSKIAKLMNHSVPQFQLKSLEFFWTISVINADEKPSTKFVGFLTGPLPTRYKKDLFIFSMIKNLSFQKFLGHFFFNFNQDYSRLYRKIRVQFRIQPFSPYPVNLNFDKCHILYHFIPVCKNNKNHLLRKLENVPASATNRPNQNQKFASISNLS